MGPQVKVVFRKENTAAIFGNERVGVSQLAPGFIQLEAGAASKPDGRNAAMIEGGSEFVKTRNAFPPGGYQVVDGDVQDERSVMQTVLRSASFHLNGVSGETGRMAPKKAGKKGSEKGR
jgi:hypothetical protein